MKTDLVVAGYIFHNDKVLLIHHRFLDMWLPVGGHIDKNETPDEALLRETKEEVGIDIEILGKNNIPLNGNVKKNLAVPFHVNVHPVHGHEHCCFFYVCKAINPEKLKINHELKGFRWLTKEELYDNNLATDVRDIGLKAFELIGSLEK